MHGRLEDSQLRKTLVKGGESRASTLLVLVDGEETALDNVCELAAGSPLAIAFVVRKAPEGAHQHIVAALMAVGAVFGGAPLDGELIQPGYLYLLDESVSLGRFGGKFVINQRFERSLPRYADASPCFERLTGRQSEILRMVVAGDASKRIAASLRISQRTVENHRAAIMRRLGARTLADLVRITVSGRNSLVGG